jgi:hypothetical protein
VNTTSTEKSPSWEANRSSASPEIPCILRNPKVHYRVYNSGPLTPILSHIKPINIIPTYSLISLPSRPRSSSDLISSGFPT